ncbi:MAG: methyltransferase domain-containing protein [Gemmatimonadetes bacterium]|nr:methyltransferase domain-containing protein [Gemmatimonadota bacterium]
MNDALQEAIAGARAYEALHVPALFQEWTARVLDAAGVAEGHRVLDLACGTGILARDALKRVGPSGKVVGVDPNPGMLAVARELADEIQWREGIAEDLPSEEASFDRVVSQFGMMFFRDRSRALREVLRVLAPGGRFAIAVWDGLEHSPAYATEVQLLDEMAGTAAADALRAPFILGDVNAVRAIFADIGLAVDVATIVGRARFPSIRAMVEADLRGWLPVMGVELEEEQIAAILGAAEDRLSPFVASDGGMEFDSPAHIVSGGR